LFVGGQKRGMELREIEPGYVVSPQIEPGDVAALAAAGFRTIINNRPDSENPPGRSAEAIRAVVEAAGLTFVDNPLTHGAIGAPQAQAQRAAMESADGPVFAYCATGNRCTIIWAMAMAGRRPSDELIEAGARWGYNLEPYRARIDALAGG
jgi:uncharacterized protein (TIGR01244 family)